jgi:uncharacterized protein YbaR (Trm112 family)
MVLPRKLIEKLACPKGHETLEYREEKNRLECEGCGLAYRIIDDIPVLEIEEAEKLR